VTDKSDTQMKREVSWDSTFLYMELTKGIGSDNSGGGGLHFSFHRKRS
jgi:hypothetical protein